MMTDDRIPVWLDCDPGHDDAFAMLIYAHHPRLRPLGISTTFGNASLKNTTHNALSLMTAFSRLDIPVFAGAEHPTPPYRSLLTAASIHGADGLAGTNLLPVPRCESQQQTSAVDALADAVLACDEGTPYIVTTGTLTNLYAALERRPSIARWVRGISIMGGCIGGDFGTSDFEDWLQVYSSRRSRIGNSTSRADPNFLNDPKAARSVLLHPALQGKITMCCLDLTYRVVIKPEIRDVLLGRPNECHTQPCVRQMMVELLDHITHSYAEVYGFRDAPLHDPVAMGVLLTEIVFYDESAADDSGEPCQYVVHVIDDEDDDIGQSGTGCSQIGRTLVRKLAPHEKGVRIPKGLDINAFWQVVESCLSRAEKVALVV